MQGPGAVGDGLGGFEMCMGCMWDETSVLQIRLGGAGPDVPSNVPLLAGRSPRLALLRGSSRFLVLG